MDSTWKRAALVIAAAAVVALTLWMLWKIPYRYGIGGERQYGEKSGQIANPFIGYAPMAEQTEAAEQEELVYISLTWAQWEPQQGVYDTEGLEQRNHIQRWKEEGKHAVLRFVCDYPGKERHMDIPGWLYQSTGDGSFYDTEYGKGYCPDYENPFFIERHEAAVRALAEYCNQDSFVAYVELGSLGHWGEWHTLYEAGMPAMPDAEACWDYVLAYSDSFLNARLLMRRNYTMAYDGGLGLYNDMTGDREATEEWLDWIENGGSYEALGNEIPYTPMPEYWKTAPAGGELTSSIPMQELLGGRKEETKELIRDTHLSFLGPNCPTGELAGQTAAEELEQELGYRIWISETKLKYHMFSGKLEISLTWENSGNAPLYWDLPVELYILDGTGKAVYWEEVGISLSRLLPGEQIKTQNTIPFDMVYRNGYSIGIGILDLDTGEPAVCLASDGIEYNDGINRIYTWRSEEDAE